MASVMTRMIAAVTLTLSCLCTAPAQTFTVKGPDDLVGLNKKWADTYAGKHPDFKLEAGGGGVVPAFAALSAHQANVAIVSRSIRYKEAALCEAAFGQRPTELKVGVNGLAVYVNVANPVKVLTYDELFGIFRGKFRNWKELDGPDAPITLYGQETNSAVGELFLEEVLNGKEPSSDLRVLSAADLLRAIGKDVNGIGYGRLIEAAGARAIAIKRVFSSTPVEPTADAISNRIYPISRYLYCYLNPADHKGELKAYLDWIRTDPGQEIVKEAGYYPLPAKFRVTP